MKKITLKIIRIICTLGIAIFFIFLSFPYVANRYVVPIIQEKIPFQVQEIIILKATPWQLVGTIRLGSDQKTSLNLPNFVVHYSPGSLFQGKINSLIIESPTIHLEKENERISVRGLSNKKEMGSDKQGAGKRLPLLPLIIGKIKIKNTTLLVQDEEVELYRFHSDIVLTPLFKKSDGKGYVLQELLTELTIKGGLQTDANIKYFHLPEAHKLVFSLRSKNIGKLVAVAPKSKKINLNGNLHLDGELTIDDKGLFFKAEGNLADFHLQAAATKLGVEQGKNIAFHAHGDSSTLQGNVANLYILSPAKGSVSGKAEFDFKKQVFTGVMEFIPEEFETLLTARFQGQKNGKEVFFQYDVKAKEFLFKKRFQVGDATLSGQLIVDETQIKDTLDLQLRSFEDKISKLKLENIEAKLPLTYKKSQFISPSAGHFSIEKIFYQSIHSGRVEAELMFRPDGLNYSVLARTVLNPDVKVQCDGVLAKTIKGDCSISQFVFDQDMVSPFVKLPEGLLAEGKVGGNASFTATAHTFNGKFDVTLNDASAELGDKLFSDIDLSLSFPNLPLFQSSPSQKMVIGELSLGQIKMKDGTVTFRVDNNNRLFIEKAKINWAGGRVETGGLGLQFPLKKFSATLYCDRLEFTELLEQFGIEDAEGEGSLNGRLPVDYSGYSLSFDDGFLFSTPGSGGKIRFSNIEQLRSGMESINSTPYLEYSLDAMKNFSYNWAKLYFKTEGEQLLLALQIDGKPAEPLPYKYAKGQIVKSWEGSGLQHPIRLDVNFRMPIDTLFQYGSNLQSIMENM